MSGGRFGYTQRHITDIADQIERIIANNGPQERDHFGDLIHPENSPEIVDKLKEAVQALKVAHVYAQRIDWLLSGDDGEESFFRRLRNELWELGHTP